MSIYKHVTFTGNWEHAELPPLQTVGVLQFMVLPGSSVHGILQARILEWVAMPTCRGSSRPRNRTCLLRLLHWQTGSLPLAPPREPCNVFAFPFKPEGSQFPGLTTSALPPCSPFVSSGEDFAGLCLPQHFPTLLK